MAWMESLKSMLIKLSDRFQVDVTERQWGELAGLSPTFPGNRVTRLAAHTAWNMDTFTFERALVLI